MIQNMCIINMRKKYILKNTRTFNMLKKLMILFRSYRSKIFISTGVILILAVTFLYANKIDNLQETILIATLISPYIILFIQNERKKKDLRDRLRIIAEELKALVLYIDGMFDDYTETDLAENEVYQKKIRDVISFIRTQNMDDLARMSITFVSPAESDRAYLYFANYFEIGDRGIFEFRGGWGPLASVEKIRFILKAIDSCVLRTRGYVITFPLKEVEINESEIDEFQP